MDAGLKQLKVISRGEDGGWERVPVSGGHRDKSVGESVCRFFSRLTAKGCRGFENRVFLEKMALGGIIDFSICLERAETVLR